MTRLAEIEAHIGSMNELLDLIGAMRSLAGMRMREAQRTLPGIRRYADALADALADTLALLDETKPSRAVTGAKSAQSALILCMAEHGFVGGFNERLLAAAEAELRDGVGLFVLGSRGAAAALERGHPPSWSQTMATRSSAATETVRLLSKELYRRLARGAMARVAVIYAQLGADGVPTVERRTLLPLDTTALRSRGLRQAPLHNLAPTVLYEKLAGEYVYALLTEAVVESIAAENAARFAAMEAAHHNVDKKLEHLREQAHQIRQSEITTELIELVAGAEAQTAH